MVRSEGNEETSNYPCQTILHTLNFQDALESNIMIYRHIPANTTKVAEDSSNDKFVKYAV